MFRYEIFIDDSNNDDNVLEAVLLLPSIVGRKYPSKNDTGSPPPKAMWPPSLLRRYLRPKSRGLTLNIKGQQSFNLNLLSQRWRLFMKILNDTPSCRSPVVDPSWQS